MRSGKVFVGGLNSEISDEDIKEHFGQFGKVCNCNCMIRIQDLVRGGHMGGESTRGNLSGSPLNVVYLLNFVQLDLNKTLMIIE